MRSKRKNDERYLEACDRTVGLHERIKANPNPIDPTNKRNKYSGVSLHEAKHGLGVRQNDEHYDARIKQLIK